MNKAEFDKFADEYNAIQTKNIRITGEAPEYFAEYKVVDTARLARKFGLSANARILDFGSGIGNSVPFFNKHFPKAHLTCVDVSEKSLQVGVERFPELAEYKLFDGVKLPFCRDSFDIVFTACVFHHIDEHEHINILKELHRVLVCGGILVIFEHNPYNPLTVSAVKTCVFDENASLINSRAMIKCVETAEFMNCYSKYRIFFPGFLKCLRIVEPMIGWVPLGAQYYVVGRKK